MAGAKSINPRADRVKLEILPLSERNRRRAAELCYETFTRKFAPILGSPAGVLGGDNDGQGGDVK